MAQQSYVIIIYESGQDCLTSINGPATCPGLGVNSKSSYQNILNILMVNFSTYRPTQYEMADGVEITESGSSSVTNSIVNQLYS